MAIQTGLEGKPWYQGAIAGAIVAAVLLLLGHQFFYKKQSAQIAREQTKLEELEAKIHEGRVAQQQLPKFREEVRRLELKLDRLLRVLPSRRNTAELLRRIRALTDQGDFDLRRFTPGRFADRDFYSEWPISISLQGTYHNLGLFFDRISRFSRIINIENLSVSAARGSDPSHTIGASFQAKTFVYKESQEEEVAE
jgi:type IV pilus assembly protein PilO